MFPGEFKTLTITRVIVHVRKKTNNKKETILEEHTTIGEADDKTEEQTEKNPLPSEAPS